jgi:hypothetical protein
MSPDEKILKIRRQTIAQLEKIGHIPRLDHDALYGPRRQIKYVELAADRAVPSRKKIPARRSKSPQLRNG